MTCCDACAALEARVAALEARLAPAPAAPAIQSQAITPEAPGAPPGGLPSVAAIAGAVALEYGISVPRLAAGGRERDALLARSVAMYLCRQFTRRSFPQLGYYFDRHHSTVIAAVNRIAVQLDLDPDLRAAVSRVRARLGVAEGVPLG